jgi:acyl-CoA thioesterase-1
MVQRARRIVQFALILWAAFLTPAMAAEKPVHIVALGDSLVAGFGLPAEATFTVRLARALRDKGIAAEIVNAGVSGDTATGGLARLDWSVPDGTDAVIVSLGGNDVLRGIEPKVTREALDQIVRRLKERGIAVLLAGMRAPPNMGPDYVQAFEAIYPDLAAKHGVVFYPFILDGVAADQRMNQRDGIHPNEAGVNAIVGGILPKVLDLVARVRARTGQ